MLDDDVVGEGFSLGLENCSIVRRVVCVVALEVRLIGSGFGGRWLAAVPKSAEGQPLNWIYFG